MFGMRLERAGGIRPIVAALLILGSLLTAGVALRSGDAPEYLPPNRQDFQTERALATAPHPARNLYQLVPRMRGINPDTIRKVVGSTKGWKVGTTVRFWINDLNERRYYRTAATLRYVSDAAYWFVEDGRDYSQRALEASARRFDEIAAKDRAAFGREWSPGVDGDPRIVVLVARTPGAGGYYSSADEYPRIINPFSNQHEMIYVDSQPGDPYFDSTLAHEFQHMIHWHEHANQDVWINEGMSEYAMELNGFPVGSPEQAFASHPDTQLDAWAEDPDAALAHYGAAYRLMSYLAHRFGPRFLESVIESPGTGLNAISQALRERDPKLSLDKVYDDWLAANYLTQTGKSQFGFAKPMTPVETAPLGAGAEASDTAHQWGADYYELNSSRPFTLVFRGESRVRLVDNTPRDGRFEWYSNRGDLLDSTLTRAFDLSRVHHATLEVDMWYDIEKDFDYAYVEVSTDGGRTWHTLPGRHSTRSNPNGNNLGNGYTGESDGWIAERFDLTPYTGRKVLLRFEYVTDDGYNAQGLAIDGVRIPEIGFSDDSETDDDWVSNGWVRTNDWVPARYRLLVINPNGAGSYVSVPVGADGRAIASFGAYRGGRPPVVVVSPTASTTTEPSHYTLSVERAQPGAIAAISGRAHP